MPVEVACGKASGFPCGDEASMSDTSSESDVPFEEENWDMACRDFSMDHLRAALERRLQIALDKYGQARWKAMKAEMIAMFPEPSSPDSEPHSPRPDLMAEWEKGRRFSVSNVVMADHAEEEETEEEETEACTEMKEAEVEKAEADTEMKEAEACTEMKEAEADIEMKEAEAEKAEVEKAVKEAEARTETGKAEAKKAEKAVKRGGAGLRF